MFHQFLCKQSDFASKHLVKLVHLFIVVCTPLHICSHNWKIDDSDRTEFQRLSDHMIRTVKCTPFILPTAKQRSPEFAAPVKT